MGRVQWFWITSAMLKFIVEQRTVNTQAGSVIKRTTPSLVKRIITGKKVQTYSYTYSTQIRQASWEKILQYAQKSIVDTEV